MENINIDFIWKEIDQLISETEVIFFERLGVFEDTEQLPVDVFKDKLDKLAEILHKDVMKILKKINYIVKNKIVDKFFILEAREIVAILNYAYEWLQTNFTHNKINYINIYDYNYWENISFFKLITSCIDKTSFVIYCLENTEIKKIRNVISSKKELFNQIKQKQKLIKFHYLIDKLKDNKESIIFFNDLKIFHERVNESTFWNMSRDTRNALEHKILSYGNKFTKLNDFITGNIFISLKLLWFINIKSNKINLIHLEKMLSDCEYQKLEQIIKYISDRENKIEITNDAPKEVKLIVHDLDKAFAGEKIDWNKYNGLIDKATLEYIIKIVDASQNSRFK